MTQFTAEVGIDVGVGDVRAMMQQSRSSHRTRRIGVVLAVAAVAAIAMSTVFAVRSLDVASDGAVGAGPTLPPASLAPRGPATTEAPATTSTTTTTAPPTTTTVPPTTTTTTPPAPSWRIGDSGPEVAALQQRLIDLNFWVPAADGEYGSVTAQAVMAFQKSAGLGRDGIAGPVTLAALETATPVGPREGGDHVEIDLERQLMFVVRGGRTWVFNTSTGRSGWRTPPGRFEITRQIDGLRRAPLGDLYRPKYFNGGIALHGSPSIPGYPASHGCTRLHDAVADLIWDADLAPIGTPVWVY